MKYSSLIVATVAVLFAVPAWAAEKQFTLPVWPGQAPGEKGDIGEEKLMPPQKNEKKPIDRLTNVSHPTITVYRPDKNKDTQTAVVICPGGGYSILATNLEGEEVAAWLNSAGVTGIVLKYRVPARKGQPKYLPLAPGRPAGGEPRAIPCQAVGHSSRPHRHPRFLRRRAPCRRGCHES